MMDFEICRMSPADTEAAARLEQLCFSEPWSQEALLDSLMQSVYVFLAAKHEGELIGYVGAYQAGDSLSVTNIAVFPLWRKRGAARQLLQELDRIAVSRDLYGITLEVRVSNAAAIALYEKNGYEKAGIRKGFYEKPREDGLIMWKYFQQ